MSAHEISTYAILIVNSVRDNAMVVQAKNKIRAEEFFQLPETNLPTELIDGEIIEMTALDLIAEVLSPCRRKSSPTTAQTA